MESIHIKIEGMSCGHCTAAVETAVSALSGVSSVKADLDKKEACVCYDEAALGREEIEAAIEDQGYDVIR